MNARRSVLGVWLRRTNLTFAFMSGGGMLLMMLAGTADIIGTNVFAWPVPGVFEFMANMMVVVVFFALSLAQARRAHIRVEIISSLMPRPVQFVLEAISYTFNAVFFALIAWFAGWTALHSFAVGEYVSGLLNWPIWPARCALFIGAALMTLQCVCDLVFHLVGRQDSMDTEFAAVTAARTKTG